MVELPQVTYYLRSRLLQDGSGGNRSFAEAGSALSIRVSKWKPGCPHGEGKSVTLTQRLSSCLERDSRK